MYCDIIFRCHVFQLSHKLTMGKIRHFPSPKLCHACQSQVLNKDVVILPTEVMSQFSLPVCTAVHYPLVLSVELFFTLITMVGLCLAKRKFSTFPLDTG